MTNERYFFGKSEHLGRFFVSVTAMRGLLAGIATLGAIVGFWLAIEAADADGTQIGLTLGLISLPVAIVLTWANLRLARWLLRRSEPWRGLSPKVWLIALLGGWLTPLLPMLAIPFIT